jgi:hypothetical protein
MHESLVQGSALGRWKLGQRQFAQALVVCNERVVGVAPHQTLDLERAQAGLPALLRRQRPRQHRARHGARRQRKH